MRVLSLFSGVGGFDLGLERAGWTTVFQCEVDAHCQQVLQHRWPTVPKWGDITTLTGAHILEQCGTVDAVAWGSPCQDLSVAGKRAGLVGERSGLFHHGVRIIKELREVSNGHGPVWSIWENVAGALSSNRGADFGQVLHEMDEAGSCFSEWAVLDAQYFGVAQRRRRVFLVSCLDPATASRCGDTLLPVGTGSARDLATLRQERQTTADSTEAGTRGDSEQNGYVDENDVLRGTVTSKWHKGSGGPVGDEAYNLVTVNSNKQAVAQGSLVAEDVVGFANSYRDGLRLGNGQVTNALSAIMGTGGNTVPFVTTAAIPIQGTIIGRQDHNGPLGSGVGNEGDPSYTLDSISKHGVAHEMRVRRLTPLECERLMGWPDNHTLHRADGKTNSDTTRYKMCGNGVASPVAQWIATQINTTLDNTNQGEQQQ